MRSTILLLPLVLALTFSVLCLTATPAAAQFKKDPRKDFVTALNERNIRAFLEEVSAISTGQRPDLLDDDVANYFNNHVSDKAVFKSKMHYDIPNFPSQATEMKLNKEEYIGTILQGRFMMEDYQSNIEIRDLKIGGGGKNATFTSVITEKGRMPFPKDPKKPNDVEMIPIEGQSTCRQRLIVSFNNFIQMARAECETDISFDPFAGKPLVPQ